MAASGDVTVAQDGGQGNVKLHPYLVTLVRWCVSCIWSTATVVLHRLMTSPLRPLAAIKPSPKPAAKSRAAGTDHLHPEPLVQCVLLHQPPSPTLDVIFVHGLYGSLGNTWRQGDWRSKYKIDPKKVPLRNHSNTKCKCDQDEQTNRRTNENDVSFNFETDLNDTEATVHNINEKLLKKIIPNDSSLITEQFYNNILLEQVEIIDNYETQAKFVQDLFKNENNCDKNGCDIDNIKSKEKKENRNKHNDCKCINGKKCDVGCGCVCDQCYSLCWPKDWIKEDYPGARVISINYTSDPYLWRPLWKKEFKRLRLHERADQMIQQLLELGVGEKPIIWVGHSKGGLFIKQIYCEAYEAFMKLNKDTKDQNVDLNNTDNDQNCNECNTDNEINHLNDIANRCKNSLTDTENVASVGGKLIDSFNAEANQSEEKYSVDYKNTNDNPVNDSIVIENSDLETKVYSEVKEIAYSNEIYVNSEESSNNLRHSNTNIYNIQPVNLFNENYTWEDVYNENNGNNDLKDIKIHGKDDKLREDKQGDGISNSDETSSISEEEKNKLKIRAGLWSNSLGFMFYSVPHRGSPLADIKTPITARSIELLEISKDCSLVLDLQERWLVATSSHQPVVRSLVETCRTLMSVLWLRIVSVDSADAGIGSLCGVSVDHREICKPSSRSCLLYTELTDLIREALNRCRCS